MIADSGRELTLWLDHRNGVRILLVGLLSILILNNFLWLQLDHTPLTMNEADHFSNSISYYRWIWQGVPKEALPFYQLAPYPPLVGWLTHAVFPFFGFSAFAAILFIQSLFTVVLLWSLYGMACSLSREYEPRILASILVFLYPVTFVAARHYLLDLPLTAMSALSIYMLFRLHRYGSRREAFLLGLTLGLGMMVKWSFAFYLTVPTLMVLFKTFRSQSARPAISQAGWITLAALLVTIPYYAPRLASDWAMTRRIYIWAQSRNDPLWTQAQGLLYYFVDFVFMEVSPLGALFFLLGAFLFLRKGLTFERGLILTWIVVPVIILTWIRYKDPRYALPYLPAVALITVIGLYDLPWRSWRSLWASTGVILLLLQYYALSFSTTIRPRLGTFALFQPEQIEFFPVYPSKHDWRVSEILDQLTERFQHSPAQSRVVLLIGSHAVYNVNTFNYLSTIENRGIRFIGAEYIPDPVQVATDEATSYIVLKEVSPDLFFDINREQVMQAVDLIRSQPSRYVPVRTLYLPDGSLVTLYANKTYELDRMSLEEK